MSNTPKASEELHKNHRLRMKERIRTQGLFSLQEHEVLEYLLYYAVQRRDTNPLAHRLIQHCGSLQGVLDTSYEDLLTVPGVTSHIAFFLTTLPQVWAYGAAKEAREQKPCLEDCESRKAFARTQLCMTNREQACVILLDHAMRVIAVRSDFVGSFHELALNIRDIMAFCLQKQAAYIILAHTHPSGVLTPSKEDLNTTALLRRTLEGMEVFMLDHILVTRDRTYSFKENMVL